MATNVTRYQPSTPVTRLPDLVDQLFQQSFVAPTFWDRALGGTARPNLPVNLYQTGESYLMHIALPGVNVDKLDIQVMGREITIRGFYEFPVPENAQPVWQSLPAGEFFQTFALPAEVQRDQVEASYEDGILTLTLPKSEHLRPKNIKVQVTR